jgi:hypothetical protein
MLWFVTPAWKRYEVSALCFEQRRWVIDRLAESGIEAHCVVIADDANLEIARSFGFDTVEQNNDWLGRRFNDGIEYAARHGAEWIVPIGSDSWIAPAYLDPLPAPEVTRTATRYALATRTALAELEVLGNGVGPYMIHRKRLPRNKRPADDHLSRGIDGSTLAGLKGVEWEVRDLHPLQYVALRSNEPQLNPYKHLVKRFGVREQRGGRWDRLARLYPPDLVERTRILLMSRR